MIGDDPDAQKRAAALAAAEEVAPGMLVGLGTGTTAAHLIDALGERVRAGLRIRAVATSHATEAHARRLGIDVLDMGDIAAVDLAIDGVDEIDGAFRAIKGGGGAMLREKIVAAAATRMVAIADGSKRVGRLGRRPVPIEVPPFAGAWAEASVRALGATPTRRPTVSDQGNLLIDCAFGPIADPRALAAALSEVPGLFGHGLFLTQIDALYVASRHGVAIEERRTASTRV